MAGLLGGMDPAEMAVIVGLLNARKGDNSAPGLLMGLAQAQQQKKAFTLKEQEEAQQRQMRQLQMDQMQRQATQQQKLDALAPQFFGPQSYPQGMTGDDQGNPMPPLPPKQDFKGYVNARMGIDPASALAMQSQIAQVNAKNLHTVAPGASLYDATANKPVFTAADPKAVNRPFNPDGTPNTAYQDYELKKASQAATRVQTNVNSFTPASEEAQKEFMKSSRATYDQLKQAPVALASIEKAKALVPAARGFMGPGGEGALQAAKFLNARLGTNIDTEGVKSAEELRTRIFFNVMDNLKKMDAQPSEMQQRMMMEALGRLGTDPNALPQVLDAFAEAIRGKVDLHNQEVTGAVQRGVKFPYNPVISLAPNAKSAPAQRNLTAIYKAQQAIKSGADPEAVRQRLREQGFDDSGL
jgi:hypothetical protein